MFSAIALRPNSPYVFYVGTLPATAVLSLLSLSPPHSQRGSGGKPPRSRGSPPPDRPCGAVSPGRHRGGPSGAAARPGSRAPPHRERFPAVDACYGREGEGVEAKAKGMSTMWRLQGAANHRWYQLRWLAIDVSRRRRLWDSARRPTEGGAPSGFGDAPHHLLGRPEEVLSKAPHVPERPKPWLIS